MNVEQRMRPNFDSPSSLGAHYSEDDGRNGIRKTQKRMVVALYFYTLRNAGGAGRMISLLADALAARGFEVHLISWDRSDAQNYYCSSPNVIWHRLGYRKGWTDKLRRTRLLVRLLRREGVQVLVGFVMSGDKAIYTATKLAGARLVAAERNAPSMYYLRYGFAQRWLHFTLLHLVDRIAVQMPEFASGYPMLLRSKIVAIPNPVPNFTLRAKPAVPDANGRFTLLAASRLDGVQKRLHCLINAFARVSDDHPNWDLRIIGDGPMVASLRQLASERGLAARVLFERATPNVFAAYANAHLFAIPSLWEGFPNALAEALAHGLPAVGFRDAAGVAQLITEGRTGWLAKGLDDAASLALVLGVAMRDDNERQRRGELAVQSMSIYVPERQFDRWADLLGSAIKETTR